MQPGLRWIASAVVVAGLGCGDASERAAPAPATPPSPRIPPSSSTTIPTAATPPSTVAAPATADDGRRFLEQRGIDPDQLSKDIAEQMRRRFESQPPR